MKRNIVVLTLAGLACLISCATLPEIGAGVCGNGIVEPGEDCDRFSGGGGTVCEACHYKCTPGATEGPSCPTGWACASSDGTCRAASGQFRALGDTPSDAFRVDVADVDGDGVGDIVATSSGQTRVRFSVQNLTSSFEIPSFGRAPVIAQLTEGDVRSDLLFSSREIAVWRGQPDRSLAPTAYPTIALPRGPQSQIFVTTADAYASLPGDEIFIFGTEDLVQKKTFIALRSGIGFVPLETMRAKASLLAGEFQVGDIREGDNGCPEIAFAYQGLDGVDVFTPCAVDPVPVAVLPEPPAPRLHLKPPPDKEGLRLVVGPRGVLMVDLNGDGHLDILVDAVVGDGEPRVLGALGLGNGHFRSVKPNGDPDENDAAGPLPNALDSLFLVKNQYRFPRAAGQLTPDQAADFVFEDEAILRIPRSLGDAGVASVSETRLDAPASHRWTEARIGDFNGDNAPDFVALSSRGMDFYAGSERPPLMNLFSHSVLNGAAHLGIGDFDGDHARDIAFTSSDTDLWVAFGSLQGGPIEPVNMGRFPGIKQVTTGIIKMGNEMPDALSDIGIMGGIETAQLVSIVRGSTDRRLLSPYELSRVDPGEQRLLQAATITAAVGRFDATPHADLAVLGVGLRGDDLAGRALGTSLWMVPSTGEAELSSQATEGVTLEVTGAEAAPYDWDSASMVAVDLDPASADPRDELVLVARPIPQLVGEQVTLKAGRLLVARLDGAKWAKQTEIDLGGNAPNAIPWRVRAVDVDGDNAKDIAVLHEDSGTSKVTVFFNKGDGQLDTSPVSVSFPDMAIVDCAWIQADDRPGKELVVLTTRTDHAGIYLVPANGRVFQEPRGPLLDAGGEGGAAKRLVDGAAIGDSIAAGDVNGDGVDDLVVQRGGSLRVYQGIAAVRR
jgi:hypothetical protein